MKNRLLIVLLTFASITFGQNLKIKDCFDDNKKNLKFCIASDTVTYDQHFGDSYRLFFITDIKTDSVLAKFYLDINRSADFPYILNFDFYNDYKIMIIQGVASFYVYSPIKNKISKNIYPDYTNCEFSDGQGSYIRNLMIKEQGKILELQVMECGSHRFDIKDIKNITEIK